jgi:uncharacterized protein (TIGR02145 family)
MNLKYLILGTAFALASCSGNKEKESDVSVVADTLKAALPDSLSKSEENSVAVIKTVSINGKEWMLENLNVSVFRNGDTIPEAHTVTDWVEAGKQEKPAWCYYEDNSENGLKYGKLYNWYAVADARGISPSGWRVPSIDDYKEMNKAFGGDKKAGAAIKSNIGWTEGGGTNASGYSGLPAGTRNFNGSFSNMGTHGYWWSLSDQRDFNAWHLSVNNKNGIGKIYTSLKSAGFSVRCIKD